MSEYRIKLEDGSILVVALTVEEAASIEDADPTSIGQALLGLLTSAGRPTVARPARRAFTAPSKQQALNDEDPDAWLERTSKEALKRMK